jgi:benzoyl-CoA reductase subunit C
MEQIMNRFRSVVEAPYEKLAEWKNAGKRKVVACSPMHFPEELIHAAGMLPVVLQETNEAITTGFSHIHPFYCGITRNMVDIADKGQLNFLDAIFYSDICVQARTATCILQQTLPRTRVEYMRLPMSLNRPNASEDTVREFDKVKSTVESIAGNKIDDSALKQSIRVYNKNRSLLRSLRDLRKANPGLLAYRDMLLIIQAGMLMPKEEHSELLEKLLARLKKGKAASRKGKKIFLSGHLCQKPKADILDLIEGMGGIIVDDDLYTGYRYYALDAEENGSPFQALVKRYLETSLPVPTRSYLPVRWDKYLVDKATANRAQGVISLVVKYCEPHLFHYPFIKEALAAAGIPHIMLETEHEVVSLEGTRTRLQAFMEMLG